MQASLDWKAAVWAGIVAGAVFITLEMLLVGTVGGMSPWAPPRMIAAIALGRDVLPPPATFDTGIFAAAMAVHFALSLLFAVILGLAISRGRLGTGAATIAGLLFGLLVYIVNFYGFTAAFPWFAMARNWISILSHAVFGLVLGWTYHRLAQRRAVPAELA